VGWSVSRKKDKEPESSSEDDKKKKPKSSFDEDLKAFFEMPVEEFKRPEPIVEGVKKGFQCPYCGRDVIEGTMECECGAEFLAEDFKVEAEITAFFDELEKVESAEPKTWELELPLPPALEKVKVEKEVKVEKRITRERVRRDRILFYTGAIMIFLGGPIIALSSWLHDWFRVPLVGDTYNAFGWLNVYFAVAGFIIFFVGIVIFIISLRGGLISNKKLAKLKTEG